MRDAFEAIGNRRSVNRASKDYCIAQNTLERRYRMKNSKKHE